MWCGCRTRCSAVQQEALALLFALQFFDVCLGSSSGPVVVCTDRGPLVFLRRVCGRSRRLMRWALIVRGCGLVIRRKRGSESVCADALSRV